jgi:hypothetical protein
MIAVSRAPIAALQDYKRRMGWTFTWASSLDSDFNYDFNTSFTEEQQRSGSIDYNYSALGATPGSDADSEGHQDHDRAGLDPGEFAAMTGTDLPHLHTRGTGHERICALRRRRLPHLLCLRARPRRSLGNVPVARPSAEAAQRDCAVVAAARRVHGRLVSP